jgi:hypothetical protein
MKKEKQLEIANSFSTKFAESILDIDITLEELNIFKNGIFSQDMDDKWNVFIIDKHLYFARSWTNNCIYKISFSENNRKANLEKIKVTRDEEKYKGIDINEDILILKKLLQKFLKRDNLFVDERLNLGLIKETIQKYDSENNYRKSIGLQTIKLTLEIYKSLQKSSYNLLKIIGLEDFELNTKKYPLTYELLSLHISKRENPKDSITFFFDQEAKELIGKITFERK